MSKRKRQTARASLSQSNSTRLNATSLSLPNRWVLLGAALIALAAVVAYWPSLSGGFILDDDLLLTDSPLIKAPTGIVQFWYTTNQPDYVPLTSSTLWLEWRLWGMNPTGCHVTNLVLHIAACLLLWRLLHRLAIPGAFLAALLFAVHPVNVESVAWVEQRKNTLSLVLFLLSILCFLRSDVTPDKTEKLDKQAVSSRWYWLSLIAFALAMFSKGSVAILPLILLLILWWQRRPFNKTELLRTAPFFLLSTFLTPVIIWFVTHGSGEVVRHATFLQRLLGAGAAIWFYLSKALLPIHLAFVYPLWNIQPADALWWLPLIAALAVSAILFWKRNSEWGRALLFTWAFYVVALLPVLGFTDPGYARYSLVADHYQHIALIAVVILIAAGWSIWYRRTQPAVHFVATAFALTLTLLLTFLSWQQSHLYTDAITLYSAALEQNPNSWMLHYNLALPLTKVNRLADANQHFQTALQLNPDYAPAHMNLAIVLAAQGKVSEATDEIQQSLKIKPDYADAHYNLGNILAQTGHLPEAIDQYEQALKLHPAFAEAHNNLSTALYQTGHSQEAVLHSQQALQLNPEYVEALSNLANAELQLGRIDQAVAHYREALQLKPNFYDANFNLGAVLLQTGRYQESIKCFEQALRSKPDDLDASVKLLSAYTRTNQHAQALTLATHTLKLARSSGQTALVNQIEAWLSKYGGDNGPVGPGH